MSHMQNILIFVFYGMLVCQQLEQLDAEQVHVDTLRAEETLMPRPRLNSSFGIIFVRKSTGGSGRHVATGICL